MFFHMPDNKIILIGRVTPTGGFARASVKLDLVAVCQDERNPAAANPRRWGMI